MNEIERAIKHFEDGSDAARKIKASEPETEPICDNIIHMNDIAISALRDKAEREKGCQYCTTGESLNGYDDVGSFAIHPNGKTHYLEVAYNDDFYNCTVYINFCPMCGRRLEVEP
jgi:hypothetical protein